MGEKYLKIVGFVILSAFISTTAMAQNADDVLRYGLQYPSYDAIGLVMPGVSDAAGFGSYQANPASMALVDESYMSFGLSSRFASEDATYLGNTSSFEDNQTNIGNAGFVYRVPTARGKLVIGGGYSQSHDFNRAFSGGARNNVSSITDTYVTTPSDDVYFAAFDAFAIDNVNPDDENSPVKSIFRVDSPYKGINQNFEVTEQGVLGEYSAFIATEFAENLIIGASIGVINGSYSYQRDFVESDAQNDYETQFEDEQGNLAGTDNLLITDQIDASFSAFTARVGAIYQITPNVNIGGSYQFENTLNIEEEFNTSFTHTLDDGFVYETDAPASISYEIMRPARANFGITARDLDGITISASAELVDYSEGSIESDDKSLQTEVNGAVQSNLEDVVNLRVGLAYEISPSFTPRIGYGYYPSPTGDFEDGSLNGDRQFYSAGFSSKVGENATLNIGAQLGRWDDQNTVYSTTDPVDDVLTVTEEVNHWNVMAGITFGF